MEAKFSNLEKQRLYESVYRLYLKKYNPFVYEVSPTGQQFCEKSFAFVNAGFTLEDIDYERFNKYDSDDNIIDIPILPKHLKKKKKVFPIFEIQYPFWTIFDFVLRISFWFLTIFVVLLWTKETGLVLFLTFILSQLLYFVIISVLFRTNRLSD